MHMADALLSPAVGLTLWGGAGAALAYSSMKLRGERNERKVPLMGVLGAFIFAAQMINFTIPATGSSGHLGGGLLLAVLLGPHAAFLTVASVLVVQALFFADGGILALGCNIINLGVFPAFIAYPLVYRKLASPQADRGRLGLAAVAAAVVGLQLGSLAVVLETVASGISALPLRTFAAVMQPIHLAIGVVEGLVTAAVLGFVRTARPELVGGDVMQTDPAAGSKPLLAGLLAAALLTGGLLSWFASEQPDGLEWSIARVAGDAGPAPPGEGLHAALEGVQEKLAIFPDYDFAAKAPAAPAGGPPASAGRLGNSVAGVAGGALSLALAFGVGLLLRRRARTV